MLEMTPGGDHPRYGSEREVWEWCSQWQNREAGEHGVGLHEGMLSPIVSALLRFADGVVRLDAIANSSKRQGEVYGFEATPKACLTMIDDCRGTLDKLYWTFERQKIEENGSRREIACEEWLRKVIAD